MKIIALFISALLVPIVLTAQDQPQEINTKNGHSFLVGKIEVEDFKSTSYTSEWYTKNYEDYSVNDQYLKDSKADISSYKILVFMGTWCGDSKREVPRFVKILDQMDFPSENLKIVAVDRRKGYYKKSPTGEEWGLNIFKVPTFIFYKNGKEVNRIVESPVASLEEDIAKIVSGKTYTPNYSKTLHSD